LFLTDTHTHTHTHSALSWRHAHYQPFDVVLETVSHVWMDSVSL